MDVTSLIPGADTIPAPAWLFLVLDILFFTIHILLINVILGGSLITLVSRLKSKNDTLETSLHGSITGKLPTTFALGVNMGVAPLLFLQVIYGHLFYASSVLLAVYWILIIPLIILAYYGAYIHIRRYYSSAILSKTAIWITALILLYIGFVFVNNMSLMVQPEKWGAYFENREGTILNWADPTLIPRYLHFVAASVAVAGLFMAMIWTSRQKKGIEGAETKVKSSLLIFGYATIVQVVIGLWFLLAIPREYMLNFMGGDLLATIVFMLGFLSAIGAIATAFAGKFRPTLSMLIITITAMVIMRHQLRAMYLDGKFSLSSLEMTPQYSVMILFFIILAIGLYAVWYMLKTAYKKEGRAA
ncbi:MAG TPA: hypothetical protein ENO18_05130 [Caldithrix sp.]|nr:hypothetical protein [Caldithrix sp.]